MNTAMSRPKRFNKRRPGFDLSNNYISAICVISSYFFIAMVITHPLIFKINHYILGSFGGYRDLPWELWLEWFVKNSLRNLGSLYFTDIVHYPVGVNVLKDSANFLIPILSSLLQSIFDLTISYNILCLLTLTLNGLGAYLLMRYLLKDEVVAFISGMMYAFNPYIITEISYGRLVQASAAWIPLYILFLYKTFNEDKLKSSISAAFFLLVTCLSSWYYGFFLIIFTIVFALYHLFFDKNFGFTALKKIAIIILLFGIIISPFVFLLIASASKFQIAGFFQKSYLWDKLFPCDRPDHAVSIINNSLALDFPLCNSFYLAGVSQKISIITICLSFVPLFFMNKRPKFWIFSSLFFYILCLGPYLKIGKQIYQIQGISIPLPYLFLYRFFPLFWILRWPGRFIVLLMLSLMVLAGNNLIWIFSRFKVAKGLKLFFSGILGCLLILEIPLLPLVYKFPIPLSKSEIPCFYYILAKEKECAIIQYPIFSVGDYGYYPGASIYGYYQTIHGKKTLAGPCDLTALCQPGQREFIYSNSFIQLLLNLQKDPASPLNYRKEDVEALKKIGFKYLVVDNNLFNRKLAGRINDKLESIFGDPKVYSDGVTVYHLE